MASVPETTTGTGESTSGPAEEMAVANKEFLHLLHEKDAMKAERDEMERKFNQSQGRNYELLQRIDQLEKQLNEVKEEKKHSNGAKHHKSSRAKHANPRARPKTGKQTGKQKVVTVASEAEKPAQEKDTFRYYMEIAENFPMLRLSVLLGAEKKFIEGDIDGDGTIDADELEKILDSGQLMFTKQQVLDIVAEIDADDSNSLDFMECLKVIDRLHQNKKTKLPTELERNKSAVCSIQ